MTTYETLLPLAEKIHRGNHKWWHDLGTGVCILETRNRMELLMLVVTEVSEYVDADATGGLDDHLPAYKGSHVELADIAIRLLDMIGAENKSAGDVCTMRVTTLCNGAPTPLNLISVLSLAAESWRKGRVAIYRSLLNTALYVTCDIAARQCDLPKMIEVKRAYNAVRADHTIAARRAAGGKRI